jgi:hypothetical protein
MITVNFSDFTEGEYTNEEDAINAILEAHAEGVLVDYIQDENENPFSLKWSVELQKES